VKETGGEKLEECCKEQGQLAEDSKEGLGSKWAVVPMMMIQLFETSVTIHPITECHTAEDSRPPLLLSQLCVPPA
jgi:hypothetical protein